MASRSSRRGALAAEDPAFAEAFSRAGWRVLATLQNYSIRIGQPQRHRRRSGTVLRINFHASLTLFSRDRARFCATSHAPLTAICRAPPRVAALRNCSERAPREGSMQNLKGTRAGLRLAGLAIIVVTISTAAASVGHVATAPPDSRMKVLSSEAVQSFVRLTGPRGLQRSVPPKRLFRTVQQYVCPSGSNDCGGWICCPGHLPHLCRSSNRCYQHVNDAANDCGWNAVVVCGRPRG